jgi:hypothetical protein
LGVVSDWLWLCFWVVMVAVAPVSIIMLAVHMSSLSDRVRDLLSRLFPSRAARKQQAEVQSVERLAADLHRLAVHLDSLERSHEMHRVARLRAISLAYDDVLRSACRTLDVEVPDGSPLHAVDRLQTEAALAQRGLVW